MWLCALQYHVPEAPIADLLIGRAIDMMRYKGLPAIEAALMGQMDQVRRHNKLWYCTIFRSHSILTQITSANLLRSPKSNSDCFAAAGAQNKKKNTKVVKDFAEELWEKQLEPLYNYKIEPWLANKTLLRLLVTDTRGNALREATREVLRKLHVEIPPHLQRDRPTFESITITLADSYGAPTDEVVLKWTKADGAARADGNDKELHGNARGDVPVLEASIPSGRRFHVMATLAPSRWAYARDVQSSQCDSSSSSSGTVAICTKIDELCI